MSSVNEDKKNKTVTSYVKESVITFMPDGNPVPEVMSEDEVIRFLRLDEGTAKPSMTLKYYRDRNLLKGIKIGRRLRYTRSEVLRFLVEQTERAKNALHKSKMGEFTCL